MTRRITLRLLMVLCCSVLSLTVQAQLSVREALLSMPDSVVPYLSRENRLDMFDYLDAKMSPEIVNDLQGKSKIVSMGADSLVLHLNDSHELFLYLFDTQSEADSLRQVIAVCHEYRVSTGQQECSVSFFNHRWQPLATPPQLTPVQTARLKTEGSTLLRRDEEVMSAKPITRSNQ